MRFVLSHPGTALCIGIPNSATDLISLESSMLTQKFRPARLTSETDFGHGATDAFQMVQFRQLGRAVQEDISLDPPGKPGLELVRHMAAGGHGEDIVEFFKGAQLSGMQRNDAMAEDTMLQN
jgi:hypothetical protein